jgi:hypothetical protein
MKNCIILMALILGGCNSESTCDPITKESYKTGLFSRNLGSVNIAGEQCQIFEQYKKYDCQLRYSPECNGQVVECREYILTRITKCPSSNATNSITYSNDKFHVEHVQ